MERKTLYVGGLAEEVNEERLRAAFIPFGELTHVNMPLDAGTQQHRGFGFVEFEEPADAKEAMANMDDAEMFGRTLKVNMARPTGNSSGKAIWDQDTYLTKRYANERSGGDATADGAEPAAKRQDTGGEKGE